MLYLNKIFFIALILLITIPANATTDWDSDVAIWVYDELKKFRQGGEDGTSGDSTLNIYSGKNEFQPFQVLVYNGGDTEITGVNIAVSESSGTYTHAPDLSISPDGFWIYKEEYITIDGEDLSRGDYSGGDWPDPLIPAKDIYYREERSWYQNGVTISAGEVQGFWIDIGSSSSVSSGDYTFNISITKSGETSKTATVILHVGNFSLPNEIFMAGPFNLEPGAAYYYHGLNDDKWPSVSDSSFQAFAIMYEKEMLYSRLGGVIWSSGVPIIGYDDATNTINNWTYYDLLNGDFFDGDIIQYGPYAGITFPTAITHLDAWGYEDQTEWEAWVQQWYDHFNTNGWNPNKRLSIKAVDEPSDEAGYTQVCNKCQWANTTTTNSFSNKFNNCWTTKQNVDELACIDNDNGFFVPNTERYRRSYDDAELDPRDEYYGYPNKYNKHHWNYLSCMQSGCGITGGSTYQSQPDYSIDAQAMYQRIVGLIFYSLDIYGEHYWGVTYDGYSDSWGTPKNYYQAWGDGFLIYPGVVSKSGREAGIGANTPEIGGTHDIPCPSIRLKLIREHHEDREWLEILRDNSQDSYAKSQIDTLRQDGEPDSWFNFVYTESLFRTARENLYSKLNTVWIDGSHIKSGNLIGTIR